MSRLTGVSNRGTEVSFGLDMPNTPFANFFFQEFDVDDECLTDVTGKSNVLHAIDQYLCGEHKVFFADAITNIALDLDPAPGKVITAPIDGLRDKYCMDCAGNPVGPVPEV